MTNKIFDDFKGIDCNDCERWWLNQCDGVTKGTERPCNSFLATRRVIIPEQIKSLNKRLKYLGSAIIVLAIINLILWVVYISCLS